MRTRTSKTADREILAYHLSALGAIRIGTFHVQLGTRLIRLGTRPSLHKVDIKKDPGAITVFMYEGNMLGIEQAQLLAKCHNNPSWKREGQYNTPIESNAKIIFPFIELL